MRTADNPITKSRKFVNDYVIALETQQKGLTQRKPPALTADLNLTEYFGGWKDEPNKDTSDFFHLSKSICEPKRTITVFFVTLKEM